MRDSVKKVIHITLLFVILLSLLTIGQWIRFLQTPLLSNENPRTFIFHEGSSVKTLAHQLHAEGLLKHPLFFVLLTQLTGRSRNLQAGEYELSPGTKPIQLIDQLSGGKVILREFTLVEGWTFEQVINALDKNPYLVHALKKSTHDTHYAKIRND